MYYSFNKAQKEFYTRFQSMKGSYRRYIDLTKSEEETKPEPTPAMDDIHGPYKGALLHPKWKDKRAEIIIRDKNQCVNCGNQNDLQVHHKQYHFLLNENRYKFPWEYSSNLLITLCQRCNQKGHNKYKVPTIKI